MDANKAFKNKHIREVFFEFALRLGCITAENLKTLGFLKKNLKINSLNMLSAQERKTLVKKCRLRKIHRFTTLNM
ncbi:MAG: hypothetical protein KGM99_17430 [Burkholderiales bacterium]|nr:hypothetical protein [Burkholderiales bacterium]